MAKNMTFGLCRGRHDLPPVDGFIFDEITDPTDYLWMYQHARAIIPADIENLYLYVTGLTAATLAVVRVCDERGINLECLHYDREHGTYIPQAVISGYRTCTCGYRRLNWGFCPACGQ